MQSQAPTQTQPSINTESSNRYIPFSMFEGEKTENMCIRSVSKQLDGFLAGGLHKGMITQVYGEAGSGKSQLAMLYMLGAISRGLPVCYLSTQKELSWKRLTDIAYGSMNEAQFEEAESFLMYKKYSDFHLGYIFIEECMGKIKEGGKGGLLVIDSVHEFMKSCLQHNHIEEDSFLRSRKHAEMVNRLRWLAKVAGSAVLLVNHAADVIDRRRTSNGRSIVPAMGPSWELNIDENIFLTRRKDIRELHIIHSPKGPTGTKKRFRIENDGFVWISDDGVEYVQ